MTDFGSVPTEIPAGIAIACDFDEVTGQSSVSPTLEDITGLTFDLTVPTGVTGKIVAAMTVESTATGANVVGGWAVSIDSVDKQEFQRTIATGTDKGNVTVRGQTTGLTAGTYTVKGRHRRVSGASTLNTDVAQLTAALYLE